MVTIDEALKKVDFAGLLKSPHKERRTEKMKAKKDEKKVTKKAKAAPTKAPASKDAFGFAKGSKSSEAIKMLAAGKTSLKDTRKKFNTLSFGRLLAQLDKNGFQVKEGDNGKCSIAGK